MLPGPAFYPEDAAPRVYHQQSDDFQLRLQMWRKDLQIQV